MGSEYRFYVKIGGVNMPLYMADKVSFLFHFTQKRFWRAFTQFETAARKFVYCVVLYLFLTNQQFTLFIA